MWRLQGRRAASQLPGNCRTSLRRDRHAPSRSLHSMTDQLKYQKNRGHSTGEGDRNEERTLALVFLRCLRHGLQFWLSANDAAGGDKLDDLVLRWSSEGGRGASALFVQLKHKSSKRAIRESSLLDVVKVYHDCYKKIKDSLDGCSYALLLCTNRNLVKQQKDVVLESNIESVHWMRLLDSGGRLYTLNPDNVDVKRAVDGEDQFIQHFYLLCNQSDCEKILDKICEELQLLLGADESCCKAICGNVSNDIRKWMNTQDFYITSSWGSWLDIVDTYIKKEVTTCNSIVTKIKYINVEALQAYIEGRNPAWIRPPGREATALTATKVHQIIRNERHIMVSVTRLSELEEKILCCWGPFCRWLVLVDDTEESCDILCHMVKLAAPNQRRLLIVSHKGDVVFEDKCKSADIPDDTWKELINVEIKLNGEQYSSRLGDLCDTEALKTMLNENPEALAALSQLTGPVRMGQDLDPLPKNHIDRRLISRMHIRENFFYSLGDYDVCIMDKLSYNYLTNVSVNKTVQFEELENFLCVSNTLWPLFVVTGNIDLPVIQMICSKFQNICVYVLRYEEDGWEILFLHRSSARIRPYVKEQSRSLWKIVDGLSSRIIVDGKPGIGKSTFLLDIATQVKGNNPSWWILSINLITYSEVFNRYSSSFDAVNDILLRVVYNEKNVGILEHSLLRHCLKEYAQIICLVDGFDEICPDYAEKCLQALQQLAPRRGKLVVATRPSVTGHLEDALGVLAHSLPAFSEEEVHRFHQGANSKLGVTNVVVELLKIPLFSRMYGEALESGIVVDDIVSLYETFFEKKFMRLYEEKYCEDLSKPGKTRKFIREREEQENYLGFLAVSHLLPKLEVPCAEQTSSIDRDELVRAGVIYQFIDNKPVFIHRTFAEHFLAKWCFSDFAKAHCAEVYCRALSISRLEFFVESFDRMASRGRPLLTAVLNGSESEVESLLLEGADLAERDEMGRNSLHLVAAYSRESTLLWLLVEHLEVAGDERTGGSPSGPAEETWERTSQVTSDLGLAEASGAAGLWVVAVTDPVTAALGAEDDLLQWTPLRYAAERRRWGAVAALLEAGAQLRHLGDFQRGLLDPKELWRVFKAKGYKELLHHIRAKNNLCGSDIKVGVSIVCAEMSPEQYKEIISEAIRIGDWEVARLLQLRLNQGITLKPRHEAWLGSSILQKLKKKLMWSVPKRQTAAQDGATRRDAHGWTELQRAVAAGDVGGVCRLIEAGADLDMQDDEGCTALHLAVLDGNVDCIKLLLSAGAAVDTKDKTGATALHRAAWLGRRQAARLLLAAGADALAQDREAETPLHQASITGSTKCVRLLVRAVKDLELKDGRGSTALHHAAYSGDVASVKHLLAAGADSNAVSHDLETPLHLAAWEGHIECARLLLQAGAGVAAKDKWGATALHYLAVRGNPSCVRCLLEAGADIQREDEDGDTPLHWAARYGRTACIGLLLREGADVHRRNRRGWTPLHCAADRGNAESVRLLLEAGADALAQDAACRTPLEVAADGENEACLALLNCAVSDRRPATD